MLLGASAALGQTSSFTYQGKLMDGGSPASGPYQMQFSLHSAASGVGNQIGSTITIDAVSVTNGTFSVELNFTAANAFDGSARWLQIAVRKPSDPSFGPLNPRQPITSTPYSIKSLNATVADSATNSSQLGGVAANQYVVTTDLRMTDARPPTAGSANYIQNNPASQQAGNFNISGNGTAGGRLTTGGLTVTGGDVRVSAGGGSQAGLWIIPSGPAAFGGFITTPPNAGQSFRLNVREPSSNGIIVQTETAGGRLAEFGSLGDFLINNNVVTGGRFTVKEDGSVGIGISIPQAKLHVGGGAILLDNNQGLFLKSTTGAQKRALLGDPSNILRVGSGGPAGFDEIRFDLGALGGTAMTVSPSGNVGIGTNSPAAKLEIQSGANFDGTGDQKAIALSFWNGGFRHWIRTRHNANAVAGNAIDFFVNNSSVSSGSSAPGAGNVHVMTLDDGNVGIGTTAPTHKLTIGVPETPLIPTARVGVYEAGNVFSIVRNTTNDVEGVFGAGSGEVIYGSTTSHPLRLRTANADRVAITSAGNVGVGTNTPGAKFQVVGGDVAVTTLGNGLILRATDGLNCFRLKVNDAGALSTEMVVCPP